MRGVLDQNGDKRVLGLVVASQPRQDLRFREQSLDGVRFCFEPALNVLQLCFEIALPLPAR